MELKSGDIVRHLKSGKLYRIESVYDSGRMCVIGQRDGKNYGPSRNMNPAAVELATDGGTNPPVVPAAKRRPRSQAWKSSLVLCPHCQRQVAPNAHSCEGSAAAYRLAHPEEFPNRGNS